MLTTMRILMLVAPTPASSLSSSTRPTSCSSPTVGVELIVDSSVRTIETNVRCTEVLLSQAGKKHKPVLIASTSEVYGKSTALPFREDGDLVLGSTNKGRRPADRQVMGAAARDHVRGAFAVERLLRDIDGLYGELLA